ncbi:MAG: hypothetical protein WAL90_18670 [Desulfobacterales bacterium]
MHVTNYQMENVLKVYTSQLSRQQAPVSSGVVAGVTTRGKRQNLIERIAADIIARIRNGANQQGPEPAAARTGKQEPGNSGAAPENRPAPFVYNVIRGPAEKKTNVLAVENADFLARRFGRLVGRMTNR